MARGVGRVLLAGTLVAAVCATRAQLVMAKNEVTVDGTTVTLSVPVDLIGALYEDGRQIAIRFTSADSLVVLSKYWADAANVWNDAFAKLTYHECVNFKLDLQFFPTKSEYIGVIPIPGQPGHHRMYINFDPTRRPTVYDPATNDPAKDTTSAFTSDLEGLWGAVDVQTISHEVGHLLGLGDDYTDTKDANGEVNGAKPVAGRAGTLMADGGGVIDQNIVDRVGELVEKAGKKLPTCWTGTVHDDVVDNAGTAGICSGPWDAAIKLTADGDGKLAGTMTTTNAPLSSCGSAQFALAGQVVPITGQLTDTQLTIGDYRFEFEQTAAPFTLARNENKASGTITKHIPYSGGGGAFDHTATFDLKCTSCPGSS